MGLRHTVAFAACYGLACSQSTGTGNIACVALAVDVPLLPISHVPRFARANDSAVAYSLTLHQHMSGLFQDLLA